MAVEIQVPQLGESIVEATVGRWLKKAGEAVEEGDPVVELETDKVNLDVPSPAAGVLQKIVKEEGDTVAIGDVIATVDTEAAPAPAEKAPEKAPEPAPAKAGQTETAPPEAEVPAAAAPSARHLATEYGVDLHDVQGSGPRGRVVAQDVEAYAAARNKPETPAPKEAAPQGAGPAASLGARLPEREERQRLSRRRLTIAQRLVEAQHTAAMLTTFNEVDLSAIMDVRKKRKEAFKEEHGVSLGFMSFFTKAVVSALKAFPHMNAELQGDELVIKHYYDIGIAVSTEGGLVVPVVRDADRKNFADIEGEIARLAKKAREGTLTLEDLAGGTFTITNGGVFGSLMSTPILNAPQVGILGMHGIQERPVSIEGRVTVRPMMYLALSYDHRVVDGSASVRFLVHVKRVLEDPVQLMLEA